MYLISAYFDESTNKRIKRYMNQIADKSGNTYMTDNHVPPHITLSAFESRQEVQVLEVFEKMCSNLEEGSLQWVSVGMFFPYVMYLTPVLNEYLQMLSEKFYHALSSMEDVAVSKFYKPFHWLPHATIGKKLNQEEMEAAFSVMRQQFSPFSGRVVRIGLAKPNPHRDLAAYALKDEKSSFDKKE